MSVPQTPPDPPVQPDPPVPPEPPQDPEPKPEPEPEPEPPPAAETVLRGRYTEANHDLAQRLAAAEQRAREAEARARRAETLAAEHERRLQDLTREPARRRSAEEKRHWLLGDWLAD